MKKIWKILLLCLLTGILSVPVAAFAAEKEWQVYDPDPKTGSQKIVVNPLIRQTEEHEAGQNGRGLSYQIELLDRCEEVIKNALLEAAKDENDCVDVVIGDGDEDLKTVDLWAFGAYTPYIVREDTDYFGSDYDYKMGMLYLVRDANAGLTNENIVGWRVFNELSEEETEEYFALVDQKVDLALSIIPEDATDETIALLLHDYIAYEVVYDYERLDDLPMESHTSGGCLTKGIAVCDGYSYTYSYLLHKYGIVCDVVDSTDMNHAWNIINLNHVNYNVDITWDDPARDRLGKVNHSYFLISDDTLVSLEHGLCDQEGYTCSNTGYESAYWYPSCSQIIMDGSMAYYLICDENDFYGESNGIYARNLSDDTVVQLVSIQGVLLNYEEPLNWWSAGDSGLFKDGGYLYYNTENEIRKVKTDGTGDQAVYQLTTENGYIYGSKKVGTKIKYFVSPTITESYEYEGGVYYLAPYELDGCEHKSCVENILKEPTCTSTGLIQYSCNRCEKVWTEELKKSGHQWKTEYTIDLEPTYLEEGKESIHCKDCGTIKEGSIRSVQKLNNPFTDVADGKYYYTPVLWAVTNNITKGTSDPTLFAPNAMCTRVQVVTFLWRSAGSPEPEYREWDITDVHYKHGGDFDKAIHWAYEQGITTGFSDHTFRPEEEVTRAQFVTFQYRLEGSPEVDLAENTFSDVNSVTHKHFIKAIIWAAKNEITLGKNGKFMPDHVSCRGDIVTFLYRAAEKKHMD